VTYSAAKSINLHVKNVPHNIAADFTERAARRLIHHGGDNIARKYETRLDENMGEWGLLVMRTKQDLQGHYDAEVIRDAEFDVV